MGIADRDYNSRFDGPPTFQNSVVTKWLLIANVVIFIIGSILIGSTRGQILAPQIYGYFSIQKAFFEFQIWRLFTYQFLHAGFMHLAFNMIALYFFGPLMEAYWGRRRFLAFYLLCGASGAVAMTLMAFIPGLLGVGAATPLIGASGAVFGILIGVATLFPNLIVHLLIPPIPLRMRTLATIIIGVAVFVIVTGGRNAGGEAAHIGGALLGWFLVRRPHLLSIFDIRVQFAPKGQSQTSTSQPRSAPGRTTSRPSRRASRSDRLSPTREDIDRVLDKIAEQGIHSLTDEERKILEAAREQLSGNDK